MWNRQIAVVEYKLKEYIISNGIKELELCMYDDKVYRIEKSKSTLLYVGCAVVPPKWIMIFTIEIYVFVLDRSSSK